MLINMVLRHVTLLNIPRFNQPQIRLKSFSSHDWMERRQNDVYIEKAQREHYRCRSAFKLLEIDDKYKIIKPGQFALDIGAAPGSWTQVLVKRTNADGNDKKKNRGVVISVDQNPVYHVPGAVVMESMDFRDESKQKLIVKELNTKKFNLIVSDMSPNITGVKTLDHDSTFVLACAVLTFAVKYSHYHASCLIKMWNSESCKIVHSEMERFYNQVNYVKPKASQSDSSEIYLLGRDFKGLRKDIDEEGDIKE